MKSFLLLILALALFSITLLFDILAKHFYLYWTTGWVDPIVHFIGGVSVGLIFIWVFVFSGFFQASNLKTKKTTAFFLIYLSIVSVLWEIYEYRTGLTHYSIPFIFDTLSDLSMDLFGGLLVYIVSPHFFKEEIKKTN